MKRLAVLGHPVSHSLSPRMHSAALAAVQLENEFSYEAIEVAPADLAARLAEMEAAGFVGANVTIPHKQAALALADAASYSARAIGAANTLSFVDGLIAAENTDAPGLLAALPESPERARALVLGAGGAGRAAAWALREAGAEVLVWNRTAQRSAELATALGVGVEGGDTLPLDRYDLLVNATSVGLDAGEEPGGEDDLGSLAIEPDLLNARLTVVDLVYGSSETELTRVARAAGATVVDGLEILVRQGAGSFRIWTGIEPPLEAMRRAVEPQRG